LSSNTLGDFAWYCGNSGGDAHPVLQKEPNFFGLYDIHGNVQEVTHDYFHPNPNNALGFLTVTQNITTDVAGASSLGVMYRNVKGGNYSSGPRTSRIATYGQRSVELPTLGLGIRLVRSIVNPIQ
jgi:formylglycine-generating enzyme required for sulfatase activity